MMDARTTDVSAPQRADRADRLKVRVRDAVPFPAGHLYRSGVRTVELDEPVDLAAPSSTDCQRLDIVRLATARGMRVIWELGATSPSIDTNELSHLHPPRRIGGDPEGTRKIATWWEGFYLGRCCWRQGPGFLQIRDRRDRRLVKYTLTEPDLMAALHELDQGNHHVSAEAVRPLLEERLVLAMGDLFWLAPYRMVRWPDPSMTV